MGFEAERKAGNNEETDDVGEKIQRKETVLKEKTPLLHALC